MSHCETFAMSLHQNDFGKCSSPFGLPVILLPMGKKRGLLLAVLFVALAGGLVWMLSRPAEPVYQGKPLSAWLAEFNGGPVDTNQAAFVAFRELGTNAIPALLKTIQSGDPPFERLIFEL